MMPQASEELTKRMQERFGDDYLENGPLEYLRACGYKLTHQWEWYKPGIATLKDMTRDEFECLLFMCHEWDYGGLVSGVSPETFHSEVNKDRTTREDHPNG